MNNKSGEKFKALGLMLCGVLVVLAAIGMPRPARNVEVSNARRLLKAILEVCPPLPENAAFSIPGYTSVQCFIGVRSDGSKYLVTDLNLKVSIPKPVALE